MHYDLNMERLKTNLIGLIKTQSNRIIASVEWVMARSLIRSQLNQVFSGFILREMNFCDEISKTSALVIEKTILDVAQIVPKCQQYFRDNQCLSPKRKENTYLVFTYNFFYLQNM